MRCATCGTENAPDSRFCGGCGAKLSAPAAGGAASRLAPTAKIPDDASYPPPQSLPTGQRAQVSYSPASIPPTNQGSIPPMNQGPASIPPTNSGSRGPSSIPPTNSGSRGPSSIPPHQPVASMPQMGRTPTPLPTPPPGSLVRPASIPPTQQRAPSSPSPAHSQASQSMAVPPPQRPLGLIAVILIADLVLAGTGAVLLGKGLSAKKAGKTEPAPKQPAPAPTPAPVQKTEVTPLPEPTPPPDQIAAPTDTGAQPAGAPLGKLAEAKSDKTATRDKDASKGAKADDKGAKADDKTATASSKNEKSGAKANDKTSAKNEKAKKTTATSAPSDKTGLTGATNATASGPVTSPSALDPQDPYAPPATLDVQAEETKQAAKSKAAFERCVGDAAPVHGSIKIAYQIRPDGSVTNSTAVENTTNNSALGTCLARAIASWHFTAHTGDALNEVRPFNYE